LLDWNMCRLCHGHQKMSDLIHIYEGKVFSGLTHIHNNKNAEPNS
jgi:hypothetical protein